MTIISKGQCSVYWILESWEEEHLHIKIPTIQEKNKNRECRQKSSTSVRRKGIKNAV